MHLQHSSREDCNNNDAQAQAMGLTLTVADNKAGYFGVSLDKPGKTKPYKVRVWRGGKDVCLGTFATAEEAALYVARTPEGKAATERPAAAPPLTSEEALQQARAEGLTLTPRSCGQDPDLTAGARDRGHRAANKRALFDGVNTGNPRDREERAQGGNRWCA